MAKPDAPTVLRELARLESSIAELYGEIGRQLPEDQSFWAGLEAEEQSHSRLLLGLIPLIEQGKVRFATERFDPMAIALACKSTGEHLEQVSRQPPCAEDALALAMSLENSLLEDSFFNLDDNDHPRVRRALEVLAADTRRHRDAIEKRLRAARLANR